MPFQHRIPATISRWMTPLLDFFYPPFCLGCGVRIHAEDVLCPVCMSDLPELPWDEEHAARIRNELRIQLPARDLRIGYAFEKEGLMRDCIHRMKYGGMNTIAFWFGRLLGERIVEESFARGADRLVPVPLNRVKQYERGFNQSEYLCRGIAFETGLHVTADVLIRRRYTRSQAAERLHAVEREKNVKDAFLVRQERTPDVKGQVLILVDDLITTGATAGECLRVLLESGAREVRLVALAMPAESPYDPEET